ncbi:MAG: amino acid adenylation domain-containing protein, partial [Chloroflexi bacterium]|nr:amino acid adenylation domain-containing protein [Chloroflexota bacterium]
MTTAAQPVLQNQADSELLSKSNLTRSQFLMWLGQQIYPDAPLYNMAEVYTINGVIDVALFERALTQLVAESDALRTVIETRDGVPQQRSLPSLAHDLEVLDFSAEADPQAQLRAWIDRRTRRPFNLAQRLFATALIKLSASQWAWYFNQHHIVTDVWSSVLIYQRQAEHYAQLRDQAAAALAALPSFADYVTSERAARESADFAEVESYWAEKLAAETESVTFYGAGQPGVQTTRISLDLGVTRTDQLRALAQRAGMRTLSTDLTLFNIFSMLVFAYLYRISGHELFRLGTPFHNRTTAAHKAMLGLFMEVASLQVAVAVDDSFASLLQKVTRESFGALRYMQPGISTAEHNRAYDVLLNYITVKFPDFAGMPAQTEWLHAGHGDSNHKLRLQVHDLNAAGSFQLDFDFNDSVFDGPQQQSAIRHFLQMFDSFLADPDRLIREIDLLSGAERQHFIENFNATDATYPAANTIIDLFEAQAHKTPDHVAAAFGAETLIYGELNHRADQLAQHLIVEGVQPGDLVALCLEHGLETLVAILGVLKAGAAYVPLDPAYPDERLAAILADIAPHTRSPVLITQPWLADRMTAQAAQIIALTPDWQTIRQAPATPLDRRMGADDRAYVIYTSGSTGTPKGVEISHRSLVNYVTWAAAQFDRGEGCAFALYSSLAFDLTVTSIFTPLVAGGQVVIYREAAGTRGLAIRDVIADGRAQVVKLTPAHLALIRDMDLAEAGVKRFIVGGEDFKTDLARTIWARAEGRIELLNEYGPTEATVGCMLHRFDIEADTAQSVPIGTPIANAQIYVLDRHQRPVPTGVIGELYIGGVGVARGYWQRPDLTAERFLSNPFAPDTRLYRTGDLARWTLEGRLEFL